MVSARLRWLGTGTTQVANIACLARDRWRALLRAPVLQVDGHLVTACLPLLIQQRRHVVVQVHPASEGMRGEYGATHRRDGVTRTAVRSWREPVRERARFGQKLRGAKQRKDEWLP